MNFDLFISTKNEESIFTSCFATQLPLLIKGPTGCGKSQLVEYMARKLNRPLIKVSCNEDTNAADLLGRFLLKSGETVWQDGPVTQALRTNSILYLDEIAEAREDVIVALHPLTDHRREVHIDKINETLQAKKDFMVVASYNPGYQKGLKELKPSTKQRFVCLSMNYLNKEDESRLISELTQISKKICDQLADLGHKIRTKEGLMLKETVSSRLLINAATLIKQGLNPRLACHIAIAEVLSDDRDVVHALKDYINLLI